MPRIIQDSDDEGDFGALSPIMSRHVSPALADPPYNASPTRVGRVAPAISATGTGYRNVLTAHGHVVQQSAPPNATANSPGSASRKRKLALSKLEANATPTRRRERKKIAKTNGQSDRRGYGLFEEENSEFELLKEHQVGGYINHTGSDTKTFEEGAFVLGATHGHFPANNAALSSEAPAPLQDDFANHDPVMMLPTSMSSTVPDATMSQLQLVEAARAEYQQNQYQSPTGSQPKKILENPSISWSDRLESTGNALRSSQNGAILSQASPLEWHKAVPPTNSKTRQDSQRTPNQPVGVELASPTSSTRSRASKRAHTRTQQNLSQSEDELSFLAEVSSVRPGAASRTMSKLTESQRAIDKSINESIRAVRATKAAKPKEEDGSEPLNSDDIAIGLPKERYKPRPSCSRSSRLTVEEPDYAIPPERAVKEKKKRTKRTKTSAPGRAVLSLEEKVERLESMGFGRSQSRKALEENDNDLESAVQALIPQSSGVTVESGEKDSGSQTSLMSDELAENERLGMPPAAPQAETSPFPTKTKIPGQTQLKRKRGRPRKDRSSSNVDNVQLPESPTNPDGSTENAPMDEIDELNQDVALDCKGQALGEHYGNIGEVVEDSSQPRAGARKRRPSPIVQPTPVSSARVESVSSEVTQVVKELHAKKRGRGRPRSTQKVQDPVAPNVDEPESSSRQAMLNGAEESQEMGENTKAGYDEAEDKQKSASIEGEASLGMPATASKDVLGQRSSDKSGENNEVETPQKRAGKNTAGPNSPPGKSKAQYRVGLSRKARIAPLLKIVKK